MSNEEKKQFDTMAKEFAIIKRWLPILVFIGTLIGLSVRGTVWFKDSIATKPDIDSLRKEIHESRKEIADIKQGMQGNILPGIIGISKVNIRVDSISKVTKFMQKKLNTKFVTETYPNGHDKNPIIHNVN